MTARTDSRGSSVEWTGMSTLDFERVYVIDVMPALCYKTTLEEEVAVGNVGEDTLERSLSARCPGAYYKRV